MKRFVIGVLLIALSVTPFLTAASASAVTSSSSVMPEFVWGNGGPGGQELSAPYGIAIGHSGNVYVVDMGNNAIKEFMSNGTFVRQWGGAGSANGEFNTPTGIAVASNGDVYVVDMMNYRVQRFASNGAHISSWGSIGFGDGEFVMPTALTLASNGNVYVADYMGVIQEFTSNGTFVRKWTMESTSAVYSLAASKNGDLYAALPADGVVERYTADGDFISRWGGDGSGDGQFGVSNGSGPMGATVTDNGHVYVTDGGNNRVQEFTSNGTFVAKWGTAGSGGGQFNTPFGIASDSGGNMYIADNGNNRIQRYFFPQNISNITAGASEVNITLPQGCDISDHSMLTPTKSDGMYNYPLGLTSFTFSTPDCVSGATVPVMLTFQTDLRPADVVARKYNSITQTYNTISGATITETIVDGQHALQLSYNVTDGGPLDEDGVANGVIVDPVGLGTLTIGAPNTGIGPAESVVRPTFMLAMIVSSLIATIGFSIYRLLKK